MRMTFLIGFLVLASGTGCGVKENADLVLTNGVIISMDDRNTTAEAIAIRDGRIIAIGHADSIKKKYVATRLEDLHGATVLPGLIDAHLHLMGIGHNLLELNLTGTPTYDSILAQVRQRATRAAKGSWIRGRGWDQNDWPVQEFPDHEALSQVSPDHYVALGRVDGHALLVNAKVLKLANITKETRDPPGGMILRRANGEPTGVLIDNAKALVDSIIPDYTASEDSVALEMAMRACLEAGLTSVHDAGIDARTIRLYKEFGKAGKLKIKIYAMLDGSQRKLLDEYYKNGPEKHLYNDFLTIAAIKLYADGALGSRGASLLEPYQDSPKSKGLQLTRPVRIEDIATDALKWGFQICTHAIGDGGNRTTLNAYENALLRSRQYGLDKRPRIEHAQIVNPGDVSRFKKLGVIASMQPTHCTSDMYWVEERLGPERIKGAYAWQTFLQNGITIACGSDAPVESFNPLWGVYAAVTRQDQAGWPAGGWRPEERMTVLQALRGFTRDAAYAAFEENQKGSIEIGKAADITILSKDPMAVEPKEILNTQVVMTIVNGKVAFRK